MYRSIIKHLSLVTCLLSISSYVSAQSKLDSIQYLNEIVITNNRITGDVIPVQTLSGELLGKLSAHNVADALRFFSGVQLKDYGGIGGLKTVNIRSMGSRHVGVFYDGIKIGNAQNGVVDLGRFSLDNMEAISLYNGQKSSIFEPAKDFASASSIYLIAKTPRYKGNKRYNITALFRAGSFGVVNPSVLWEQKLSVIGACNLQDICNLLSLSRFHLTCKYVYFYLLYRNTIPPVNQSGVICLLSESKICLYIGWLE
ncbi:TonB-dependent receptor-like protein [Dysgonomonas alginatilytica]|uniref:TonB-dependent receptor-like protein n=1 Tax=Dysgonomonas alginatilytica TaxID=1605892 RepID=A0A2V3PQ73_9BACT|nr:TonB-dependent receptor-like protein [Dysgonomonas alginatilytica]